jgi:AmiR/NasT family two-component response regulator
MKQRHLRSFRGLHALINHPPGRDRTVLKTQLEFLGLRVTVDEAAPTQDGTVDIFFFDADAGQAAGPDEALPDICVPTVALIGSETPGRLEAMLARQPSAYLMKPIRSTGIYSSLAIAMHQYSVIRTMRRQLASAEERLRSRRVLFSAVLRIMNQAQIDEMAAFRVLQRTAMSQRITIEVLSARILSGQAPLPHLVAS